MDPAENRDAADRTPVALGPRFPYDPAMRRLPLFVLPLLVAAALQGADTPPTPSAADRIDAATRQFEAVLDREFQGVRRSLDAWRDKRKRSALTELGGLLTKASPEDRVYVAYHVLSADPKHRAAREVFTKVGIAAPFDEKGVAAPDWTCPACSNRDLVEKVSALTYPPFEVVREAIDPRSAAVSGFWKANKRELDKLTATLVGIAREDSTRADAVYPVLAYFRPEAPEVRTYYASKGKPVPRQRVWFNPVDRWLLDKELAGIDCLDPQSGPQGFVPAPTKGQPSSIGGTVAWTFPEYLRACRIEGVLSTSGGAFQLTDDKGRGVRLSLGARLRLTATDGKRDQFGEWPAPADLASRPTPIALEARGRDIVVRVGGAIVGSTVLPQTVAWRRAGVEGPLSAQQLRVRYLADATEDLLGEGAIAAKPTDRPDAPAKPVEPAWKEARTKELAQRITFDFSDTAMEEVVAMLNRLSSASFTLDPGAEPLKDLPVSLRGDDMTLATALEWIAKLTGLQAEPGEKGFTLVWKR